AGGFGRRRRSGAFRGPVRTPGSRRGTGRERVPQRRDRHSRPEAVPARQEHRGTRMSLTIKDIPALAWDKGDGLLPAIVQDAASGAVLMLAYMNAEALRETLSRGRAVFFSR